MYHKERGILPEKMTNFIREEIVKTIDTAKEKQQKYVKEAALLFSADDTLKHTIE